MSRTSTQIAAEEEAFVSSLAEHSPSEAALLIAKRYDGAAMGHVATLAKKVVELEGEYRTDVAAAVPLPEASPADVLIDLALASHVKQLDPIPTKLESMSERVRLAIARTPPELAGIKPEVQARVRGSLMDPVKAVQLGDEQQALQFARSVVQAAIYDLSPDAQETPQEMVRMFGSAWKLPGVAESMVERLADRYAAPPESAAPATAAEG